MDELVVAAEIGEGVDHPLVDDQPVRDADLVADPCLERRQRNEHMLFFVRQQHVRASLGGCNPSDLADPSAKRQPIAPEYGRVFQPAV